MELNVYLALLFFHPMKVWGGGEEGVFSQPLLTPGEKKGDFFGGGGFLIGKRAAFGGTVRP